MPDKPVAYDLDGVREILRSRCEQQGGQKAFADKYNLSTAYISDVLNGRRHPGPSMLAALGLTYIVRYVPLEKEPTDER